MSCECENILLAFRLYVQKWGKRNWMVSINNGYSPLNLFSMTTG